MSHDLIVVGAGPIGLAAAAHARSRGLSTLVLEAGSTAGAAVSEWGHVRLFSPWSELVDPVAEKVLAEAGWTVPEPTRCPTGAEWVADYLRPLADALSADGADIRYGHRVTGVARSGRDRLVDADRAAAPFSVHVQTPAGPAVVTARSLVDASGTWGGPNPLGSDGLPALGEREHADRISYRVPDFTDPAVRRRYAGRRVAVAGTGASAQNVLVDLVRLAEEAPGTEVVWLVRRGAAPSFTGDNDQLEARGALGRGATAAARSRHVATLTGFRTSAVAADDATLTLTSSDGQEVDGVDEVVAVTGFRPDLTWLGEVRLDLDPVLSAPTALAPMIDPNVHSCGTVEPHGASVLAQPEEGLYLVGMKSYGRAPSFLALTGFEQARSVVAAIAGDHEAARRVDLTLPETGVCGGAGAYDAPADGCCGTASSDLEVLTVGGTRRG